MIGSHDPVPAVQTALHAFQNLPFVHQVEGSL